MSTVKSSTHQGIGQLPESTDSLMNFLRPQREVLETFLPGFDADLKQSPLNDLESRNNPSICLFKAAKGPGLLVPKSFGGVATPSLVDNASRCTLASGLDFSG